MRRRLGWMLVLSGLWATTALAQNDVDPDERAARAAARQSFLRMINVDALIDNYTRFLGRKYDLTTDQSDFTKSLLKEKTDAFMGDRREELYSLVDRLFEVRSGGEMNPSELMEWGKSVMPIYEEAKNLINTGNTQFREILDERQKKIHDEDLRLMAESFSTTEDQLERITTGQMSIEEFRQGGRPPKRNQQIASTSNHHPDHAPPPSDSSTIQPDPPMPPPPPSEIPADQAQLKEQANEGPTAEEQAQMDAAHAAALAATNDSSVAPPQPPSPRQPRGRGQEAAAANAGEKFESQWETYVREFCARYKFDEEQKQRAQSILKDCQDQAGQHLRSIRTDLEKIEKDLAAAGKGGPEASKKSADLNQAKSKLVAPINDIFDKKLKPRLEKLPTRAQRAVAEATPAVTGKGAAASGGKPVATTPGAKPPAAAAVGGAGAAKARGPESKKEAGPANGSSSAAHPAGKPEAGKPEAAKPEAPRADQPAAEPKKP